MSTPEKLEASIAVQLRFDFDPGPPGCALPLAAGAGVGVRVVVGHPAGGVVPKQRVSTHWPALRA
jgi:hypothetical protein